MSLDYDPRRTPWELDELDFYEIDSEPEQLKFLLRYATLAPSPRNLQPWSFRITSDGIEVVADMSRRLPVADPDNRELFMSAGTAVTNLRVAAAHFGYESTTLYPIAGDDVDERAPLCVVALHETCDPPADLRRLFPAITRRHTNRQPFDERVIDPNALSTLCDFIEEYSDFVQLVAPHDRARVAQLVAEGDRQLIGNSEYRNELGECMRPNESSSTDGLCGDAFGIPGPVAALGSWMIRSFDSGPALAHHDRDLVNHAAGLLVITAEDDRTSLVRAGETLELLLLLITSVGLQYSFMNQPVAVPELRRELASLLRSPHPPQLMLRIGYSDAALRHMPRRAIDDLVRP
jgi:hypothetical protein